MRCHVCDGDLHLNLAATLIDSCRLGTFSAHGWRTWASCFGGIQGRTNPISATARPQAEHLLAASYSAGQRDRILDLDRDRGRGALRRSNMNVGPQMDRIPQVGIRSVERKKEKMYTGVRRPFVGLRPLGLFAAPLPKADPVSVTLTVNGVAVGNFLLATFAGSPRRSFLGANHEREV